MINNDTKIDYMLKKTLNLHTNTYIFYRIKVLRFTCFQKS